MVTISYKNPNTRWYCKILPAMIKCLTTKLISPLTIQDLCFILNLKGFQMQKVQTPFEGNSSDFSNMCDSPCEKKSPAYAKEVNGSCNGNRWIAEDMVTI